MLQYNEAYYIKYLMVRRKENNMKKKFGFTLAEVLITLAIIGVVAALTAPTLIQQVGQAKIGPSLSKFVNTFETAMEQYMEAEEVPKLEGNLAEIASLSNYMLLAPEPSSAYVFKYTDARGKKKYTANAESAEVAEAGAQMASGTITFIDYLNVLYNHKSGTIYYRTKDGMELIVYVLPAATRAEKSNNFLGKGAYKGAVAQILVDINGDNGREKVQSGEGTGGSGLKYNNKAGKDVFAFYLDANGKLIPFGSAQHINLGYGRLLSTSGTLFPDLEDSNEDDSECALDDDLAHNLACTGFIADHGWKADYQ